MQMQEYVKDCKLYFGICFPFVEFTCMLDNIHFWDVTPLVSFNIRMLSLLILECCLIMFE